MALRSAPLLLLVLVTVTLQESCFGASSHSMKYFYTTISEPSQGLPHFIAVGYLDGQVFVRYDSNSRRMKPQVSWMEKVGKDDPQYWERNTKAVHGHEKMFREGLETLRSRYNQSEGLHTLQRMFGCDLQGDGSKDGFDKLGYEGRTFNVFDLETLTWVAPNDQAQITQRECDALPGRNQRKKAYLEKTCIEWLKKYLSYKMETLQRTEPTNSNSNLGLIIISCVVANLVLVGVIAGNLVFFKIFKMATKQHQEVAENPALQTRGATRPFWSLLAEITDPF